MIVSTKGRYALRVMIDLAEHPVNGFTPLHEIAKRQEISEKYLEIILKMLVQSRLIVGLRGKGGGYRLNRPPEETTVGEVLRCTEDSLSSVACLDCPENTCPRATDCRTLPMWAQLNTLINRYFDGITIADLAAGRIPSA